MWYGFILEYDAFGEDVNLNCTVSTSDLSEFGNPGEVVKKHSRKFDYALPLKGNEKSFTNPQYILSGNFSEYGEHSYTSFTSCSVDAAPALKFKSVVRYGNDHRVN